MEWVLQVVDEIDDVIGVVRHGWIGVNAQIGLLFGAMAAAAGAAFKVRAFRRAVRHAVRS